MCPGGVRDLAPGRRNGREKLEGSTDVGGAASGETPAVIRKQKRSSATRDASSVS
jgi:hypothetical protein